MKLFAPGPAECLPSALEILGQPVMYHRSAEFDEIYYRVHKNLNDVFKTNNGISLIFNGSGTHAMDNSVCNLFNEGEKVLVISTGNFGDRFIEIASTYKLDVITLNYEWGYTYNIDDVKSIIEDNSDLKGIFVTHSETSTGVLQDISSLGKLTKGDDILLVVDTISGLIMNEFDFDGFNVDVALSASQKGFMIPPGLNFVCLSQKAIEKLPKINRDLYYNSFSRAIYNLENNIIFTTVNTSLIRALDHVVSLLLNEGIDNVNKRYSKMYDKLSRGLISLGYELYVKDSPSKSLVSVTHPENIDLKELLEKYNIIIGGGIKKLKGYNYRVGVMNYITEADIDNILEIVKKELENENL